MNFSQYGIHWFYYKNQHTPVLFGFHICGHYMVKCICFLHNVIFLLILIAYKKTSTLALETLTGLPTLDIQLYCEAGIGSDFCEFKDNSFLHIWNVRLSLENSAFKTQPLEMLYFGRNHLITSHSRSLQIAFQDKWL